MPDAKQNDPTGSAKGQSYQRAITEAIDLTDHDQRWIQRGQDEINRLMTALPSRFVEIYHFGSTAVAGLIAKDSIDLIASLTNWDDVDQVIEQLRALGYAYDSAANENIPGRRWLFRHEDGHRTHHIHLVAQGSAEWSDRVDFCEMLKRDPALRQRYAELKQQLAADHPNDRSAYSNGKSEFIQAALKGQSD